MSLDKVYDTRIIGAGLSGIGAACRFKTAFPAESLAVIEARNAVADKLPDNGATREEMDAAFDKMAITTPKKAAQVILKGAAKKKRRILIGGDARFISLVSRFFPVGYSKILEKYSGDKVILGEKV